MKIKEFGFTLVFLLNYSLMGIDQYSEVDISEIQSVAKKNLQDREYLFYTSQL